ncbi:hypothetical protein [Persicirhabdus sediminis]|uniref:Uncharacterized protein n=1 Tax=Persicirhabdus sediminis TaxID=454144 RepID=A0A8J7SH42_9BACT|nr:hypothetical protein [Persicirhabdus sediminis]MBK1789584.1 hypothetical protein [Persicirhabdus sediminis]
MRKSRSLFDGKVKISNGSIWTIAPKTSVLHVPDHLKSRLSDKPKGRLVQFSEFANQNRSLIKTYEVTEAQIRGEEPIPDEVKDQFAVQRVIVVASNRHRLVSMKPFEVNSNP